MQKAWSQTNQSGFSVVEVLLAATLFAMLATAIVGALVYGQQATTFAGERVRANAIASEGLEAIRNIRDASYSNLADGTYGLAQSSNTWGFSGSSDTTGIFTRQVTIASNGTNRKAVTSTVTWPQGLGTAQTSTTTELTNWMASLAKTWPNAVQSASYDASGTVDAIKVATVGNYAYVVRASGSPNFLVVNVSNPAAPTLAASLTLATNPTNITVSGNYAYVTTTSDTAELQIVNITTPTAPVLTSSYNASGTADGKAVYVSGSYAYLARAANAANGELTIVNVSNPASPTLAGSYSNNITMNDIVVSGSYAFIGTSATTNNLLVVNVSVPLLPTLSTSYSLQAATAVNALALKGSTTLLVGQATTLSLLDLSSPTAPTRVGGVTTTGSAAVNDISIDSSGTYAFLGTSSTTAEFQIANISTPSTASIIRTVDISGTSSTLNGVAYNTALDIVVGASAADTQEVVTFVKG